MLWEIERQTLRDRRCMCVHFGPLLQTAHIVLTTDRIGAQVILNSTLHGRLEDNRLVAEGLRYGTRGQR